MLIINRITECKEEFINQPTIQYQGINMIETDSFYNTEEQSYFESVRYKLALLVTENLTHQLKYSEASEKHFSVFSKCSKLWNALNDINTVEIIYNCFKIKIKGPTATSFMSFYRSIEEILDCSDKINAILKKINLVINFDESDITYLKELRDLLKHFAFAITHLETDNQGYLGSLMPLLFSLKTRLEKLKVQKFIY